MLDFQKEKKTCQINLLTLRGVFPELPAEEKIVQKECASFIPPDLVSILMTKRRSFKFRRKNCDAKIIKRFCVI